ncbi:MAG: dTMP kinase [Candidatus Aenigmarchaeota archaeon]|nr:dTMP kinase [Candidatus Aenigmarchaeota archaeon]
MTGKLIAIEGCDGSGLSTQTKLLCEFLRSEGREVLQTKEPTESFVGKAVRSVLRKEVITDQKTLQLLFCADRAHHLESEIMPALEKGKIVVTDRYIMSTLAFGSLDVDMGWLKKLNEKFPVPDLTIIIDVPEDVSIRRIKSSRPETELFEETGKLKKIRENYKALSEDFPNALTLDGTKTVEEVFRGVKSAVERTLNLNL